MDTAYITNKSFKKGELIIRKGEKSTGIHYMKKGHAVSEESGIRYGSDNDSDYRFFGVIGSISDSYRTSNIVAETDVEVMVIDYSILMNDESIHTVVHELMAECVDIIIDLQNRLDDSIKENEILKEKIKNRK